MADRPNPRGSTAGHEADRDEAAGASPAHGQPNDDPCGDLNSDADRQCQIAESARERVNALAAELAAARAEQQAQLEAEQAAELAADPHHVRDEREMARGRFDAARETATSAREIAAAASVWLEDVDRINAAASAAHATLERARASVVVATATAEHLAAETEAARLAADQAEAACAGARRRAADCAEAEDLPHSAAGGGEESDETVPPTPWTPLTSGTSADRWSDTGTSPMVTGPVVLTSPAGDTGRPRTAIERMLSGEHQVIGQVAAALADDAAGRRQWENRLTSLLEVILRRALDAAALAVPADHLFWAAFTPEQSREIVFALAALGHRFDGLGGWVDGRTPDQRDLALAVAHAGLDPMRIRRWPTATESDELLRDAVILGADYLVAVAPSLTLEEITAVLGREGEAMADIWPEWDRVRPALLATADDSA
jgi:hypothetical protein